MSYLAEADLNENNFPIFTEIKNAFGFVPNFFRAQTIAPRFIGAEVQLMAELLVQQGALSRQQKEYIFLVCSAANLSTYCVTAHCEIVRILGIEGPDPEQIAVDHGSTNLPMTTKALLNFALKLNSRQSSVNRADVDALRTYGFSDEQILEAVLIVGFAKFANFVSFGLGTVPDFDSSKVMLPGVAAGI